MSLCLLYLVFLCVISQAFSPTRCVSYCFSMLPVLFLTFLPPYVTVPNSPHTTIPSFPTFPPPNMSFSGLSYNCPFPFSLPSKLLSVTYFTSLQVLDLLYLSTSSSLSIL